MDPRNSLAYIPGAQESYLRALQMYAHLPPGEREAAAQRYVHNQFFSDTPEGNERLDQWEVYQDTLDRIDESQRRLEESLLDRTEKSKSGMFSQKAFEKNILHPIQRYNETNLISNSDPWNWGLGGDYKRQSDEVDDLAKYFRDNPLNYD